MNHEIKLGKCVVCSRDVRKQDLYIKAVEGYVHRRCATSRNKASA